MALPRIELKRKRVSPGHCRISVDVMNASVTKDRMGYWTYFGYDSLRRRMAETNANSVVTRYGYCDCGQLQSITNAWGATEQLVTSFDYDYQGHRRFTYLPDAAVTNWFDSQKVSGRNGPQLGPR